MRSCTTSPTWWARVDLEVAGVVALLIAAASAAMAGLVAVLGWIGAILGVLTMIFIGNPLSALRVQPRCCRNHGELPSTAATRSRNLCHAVHRILRRRRRPATDGPRRVLVVGLRCCSLAVCADAAGCVGSKFAGRNSRRMKSTPPTTCPTVGSSRRSWSGACDTRGARVWIPDDIDPFLFLYAESTARAIVAVPRSEEVGVHRHVQRPAIPASADRGRRRRCRLTIARHSGAVQHVVGRVTRGVRSHPALPLLMSERGRARVGYWMVRRGGSKIDVRPVRRSWMEVFLPMS